MSAARRIPNIMPEIAIQNLFATTPTIFGTGAGAPDLSPHATATRIVGESRILFTFVCDFFPGGALVL
jgi:hypothetical protein